MACSCFLLFGGFKWLDRNLLTLDIQCMQMFGISGIHQQIQFQFSPVERYLSGTVGIVYLGIVLAVFGIAAVCDVSSEEEQVMIPISVGQNGNGADDFPIGCQHVLYWMLDVFEEPRAELLYDFHTVRGSAVVKIEIVTFGSDRGILVIVRVYGRGRGEAIPDQKQN